MTIDEALLEETLRTGGACLRLYRWDPPTLSIGRNQSHNDFAGFNLPIVRRPTGGQAVWHDREVTYAVAAPVALFGSLRRAYEQIQRRLARALRTLGADVQIAPGHRIVRPPGRPVSCFAAPVAGEILARGKKLVGSAQVRRRDAFLQHGSILLDGSQRDVPGGGGGGGGGEITLRTVLGRPVTFDEVAAAVSETWSHLASLASA
jgi:lipoate-protein ligase A